MVGVVHSACRVDLSCLTLGRYNLDSIQWYILNLSLAHLVVCVVGLWIGSAITLCGSRFAYAMNGLLTIVYVMYVLSCFCIKACYKMTENETFKTSIFHACRIFMTHCA